MKLCLIGGTGRSGTTILKKVFSRHPNVSSIPEWRILVDPDGLVEFYTTVFDAWSPFVFDRKFKNLRRFLYALEGHHLPVRIWNRIFSVIDHPFGRKLTTRYPYISIKSLVPDYRYRVEKMLETIHDFSFQGTWTGMRFFEERKVYYHTPNRKREIARILGEFYLDLCQQTTVNGVGISHAVEDNTWNILYFDRVRELVPQSKLVHIKRDPRDIVASMMDQKWAPSNAAHAARFVKDLLTRWEQVRSKIAHDSYMETSLEDLVSNPEKTLKGICLFWDLPYSEELLSVSLDNANIGRWKTDIPSIQIGVIEEILSGVRHGSETAI